MDAFPTYITHTDKSDSVVALFKAFLVALSICLLVFAFTYTITRMRHPATFSSAAVPTSLTPLANIPYTSVNNADLGSYQIPLVTMPVKINQLDQEITFLIDTGAIITALPMNYLGQSGLDLTTMKRMLLSSLTSQTVFGYLTQMDATVNGHTLNLPVSFAPIDTPVLGRFGFLDTYTLVFDHQNQAVIIAGNKNSTTP
jgi:hypothetical protein